jgi:methylenetetrahydrofolate reductase (NADPH)
MSNTVTEREREEPVRSTQESRPRLSFEFFPPKTAEGKEKLYAVHAQLRALDPDFFSVTYGAGGSTRTHTRDVVLELARQGSAVAPHLSFGGDDAEVVEQLLHTYRDHGIRRIVALRGDVPSGIGGMSQMVFAAELVAFIRARTGDHFHLEVAAYPEMHPHATDMRADVRYLRKKFDAGANSAITQFFYNADAYFWFLDDCRRAGIDAPIYPGIMPIINYQNLARFARNCGAEIPRWLHNRLEALRDDPIATRDFATEFVSALSQRLLDGGAPGLHLYTMNQAEPPLAICRNLGFC